MLNKILNIVAANVKDASILTELSASTFRETFASYNTGEDMDLYLSEQMSEAKITAELNDAANLFFLAFYEGMLVGYIKISSINHPEELAGRKPLEIERLYVLKAFHDKKIGLALMSFCIDLAVKNRHDTIWLGVWEHNHRAINFYKRFGFEAFGSHIFRVGTDDQTDVLMKKVLHA